MKICAYLGTDVARSISVKREARFNGEIRPTGFSIFTQRSTATPVHEERRKTSGSGGKRYKRNSSRSLNATQIHSLRVAQGFIQARTPTAHVSLFA